MPKLTLSMIVKNEEKYLKGCLESVSGIADEIVIVDTGSTDSTIEIAESFGAKVYHFDWINDFSAARNFALSKSSGNWILYLDADERLSEKSAQLVKQAVRSSRKEAYFCIVHSIDTRYNKSNKMHYARLFRNDRQIRFSGTIHEQIIYSLREQGYKLHNSEIEIIHLGYNISPEGLKEKARRNLEYLTAEYQKEKDPYTIFQLAQTYAVLNDRDAACRHFNEVLGYECPDFYKAHAYRYMAACELDKNNLEYALQLAGNGLKYDTTQPLLNYITAKIYNRLGNYEQAVYYLSEAIKSNKNDGSKEFEIYVDNKLLISLGIQLSVLSQNSDSFNYFYAQLLLEDKNAGGDMQLSLMREIISGSQLSDQDASRYAEAIDDTYIETIFVLLQNYQHKKTALKLLQAFPENIKGHQLHGGEYLNTLGMVLMDDGQTDRAAEMFELSLAREIRNPSVVFFLMSIYVNAGEFERVPELLKKAETTFAFNRDVMEKIGQLKQQIAALQ